MLWVGQKSFLQKLAITGRGEMATSGLPRSSALLVPTFQEILYVLDEAGQEHIPLNAWAFPLQVKEQVQRVEFYGPLEPPEDQTQSPRLTLHPH